MDTLARIKQQISDHAVILYMKGSPDFPQCGFSATVAHILKTLKANFAYVNILDHPDIRATLPVYADWPTFPQLYIQGELVGGCDIVKQLNEEGELHSLLLDASAINAIQSDITAAI